MDRPLAAGVRRVQCRGHGEHRDLVGGVRRRPERDRHDEGPHRPAVRGEHRPGLRGRSGRDHRVRHRPGGRVRDHFGREPHQVHRAAEGRRAHRVPGGPHPAGGGEGSGSRCGRSDRGGGRGRWVQEPPTRLDDGPAPVGDRGLRPPGGGRRRLPGRADHCRGAGLRRGGHPAGDGHGVLDRVTGPSQLEAGDHRIGRDRHRVPQRSHIACPSGAADVPLRAGRVRPRTERHGLVRIGGRPVLRRRPRSRDRPRRPGGRAYRLQPSAR